MILAGAALLRYAENPQASQVSRAIYESVFEAVYDGIRTPDLGGKGSTSGMGDAICEALGQI